MPTLIIKCQLKLTKILEKIVETLDIGLILLAMHEFLIAMNPDSKSQADENTIRTLKTIINELGKLKRDSLWESYQVVRMHPQPD